MSTNDGILNILFSKKAFLAELRIFLTLQNDSWDTCFDIEALGQKTDSWLIFINHPITLKKSVLAFRHAYQITAFLALRAYDYLSKLDEGLPQNR